ncbi:hypothetical protein [Kribbella sp. NPDC055071]
MKYVKAFGRFWYDFIIGDDWKIAAAVLVALIILFAAMTTGLFSDTALTLLGAALVIAAFTISLLLDIRPKR